MFANACFIAANTCLIAANTRFIAANTCFIAANTCLLLANTCLFITFALYVQLELNLFFNFVKLIFIRVNLDYWKTDVVISHGYSMYILDKTF